MHFFAVHAVNHLADVERAQCGCMCQMPRRRDYLAWQACGAHKVAARAASDDAKRGVRVDRLAICEHPVHDLVERSIAVNRDDEIEPRVERSARVRVACPRCSVKMASNEKPSARSLASMCGQRLFILPRADVRLLMSWGFIEATEASPGDHKHLVKI